MNQTQIDRYLYIHIQFNMETERVKTTLYLDRELYEQSKIEAIKRHTSATELINCALKRYLEAERGKKNSPKRSRLPKPLPLGSKYTFDREELHGDHLRHKLPNLPD